MWCKYEYVSPNLVSNSSTLFLYVSVSLSLSLSLSLSTRNDFAPFEKKSVYILINKCRCLYPI